MPRGRSARGLAGAAAVAAAYCGVTVLMTWPVAAGLSRDVATDLGDPLYYMWAIAWDCTQLLAILGGDLARIPTFFDANIFHPEPFTLAYSDHLIAQAVQVLPLFALTGNAILSFNVLFLSTFVLCGLGTYLFVRELTGSARAAFVAGLLFAFAPYRLTHAPHLNILSVQWAPFALYGLRRYFDTGRRLPLAGAAAALIAQHLSSGYYLLFFSPFVAVYAIWEIAARRAWAARRMWLELTAAAAVVVVATLPFFLPYVWLRDRLPALRDLREISRHSADVYGYLTAPSALPFWGGLLRLFPRPEGDLFPGMFPVALAAVGIAAWAKRAGSAARAADPAGTTANAVSRREWAARALLVAALALAAFAAVIIFRRRVSIDIAFVSVSANDVTRVLALSSGALLGALALSRRARSVAARLAVAPQAWAVTVLVIAWWLSLGPAPTSFGRPLNLAAPYMVLLDYVPGFSGVRAPARFAMIVAFALAVLAGFGSKALLDSPRWGRAVVTVVALGFLAEARAHPFPVNVVVPVKNLATPEPRVYPPERAPSVYAAARGLPAGAVLVELPFGRPQYDRRSMYYSTTHWRPLLNGDSGYYPPDYPNLILALSDIPGRPELAWETLRTRGVTHAIVHEAAYLADEGVRISTALRARGATEVFRDGRDVMFALPSK